MVTFSRNSNSAVSDISSGCLKKMVKLNVNFQNTNRIQMVDASVQWTFTARRTTDIMGFGINKKNY